jgi:hypothetical protein
MQSIYQKYLGNQFENLDPKMQERLGLVSNKSIKFLGTGIMKKIKRGGLHTLPALKLGEKHHLLFPNTGHNIPFTIENFAYRDELGREAVAWIRRFYFPQKIAKFDATMVYSASRRVIVDYLGIYHRLVVDLDIAVDTNGGFTIHSNNQKYLSNHRSLNIPAFLAGNAVISEWYDDKSELFKIKVNVTNKYFGFLFGYEGEFKSQFIEYDDHELPDYVKPLRLDKRE